MIDLGLITGLVALTIVVALLFDFYNGLNDAANAIATVVATRALPPWAAVLMAATFNFLGAFVGTAVASAVGKGFVDPALVTTQVILAALLGGIAWTAFATANGLPISVSHSLIGGLIGAGLATAGLAGIVLPSAQETADVLRVLRTGALLGLAIALWAVVVGRRKSVVGPAVGGMLLGSGLWLVAQIFLGFEVSKLLATVLFIVYSPLLGFVMAYLFSIAIIWGVHKLPPGPVKRVFRWLQVGSASFYALGHGTNDAQKTMGVITALLVANGVIASFEVPFEVILAAGTAIGLGTLLGGYKVVRTMGHSLTHLDTHQGFAAETSSALGLFFLAHNGVPVSTTHSITGSILGVGAVQRVSAVSWGVARRIVGAWVITIPMSALVAAICYFALNAVL
jgi:inorganic phosphate transporter, PiT family